jgi:Rps23 Pro-64 3,4-dihydroxylase Tpa1-like proline 4-hydroxylase
MARTCPSFAAKAQTIDRLSGMNEQELLEKYAEKSSSLCLEAFSPLVNESFVYKDASGNPFELTLSAAEEGQHNREHFDSFTLVFTSARDVFLPQGNFLLEHKTLGEFPLFLVPTASLNQERNTYCSYFSRRKKQ